MTAQRVPAQVLGHRLVITRATQTYPKVRTIIMDAGCECGEDGPMNRGVLRIRAWHREHKQQVISARQSRTQP